jgi:acyl carrier protein
MTDLSNLPQGNPARCPSCGAYAFLELVEPAGVALCARCGRRFLRNCSKLAVSPGPFDLSTLLDEDLGADSFDVVELMTELEQEFDVSIPQHRAKKVKTIGDVIATIEGFCP